MHNWKFVFRGLQKWEMLTAVNSKSTSDITVACLSTVEHAYFVIDGNYIFILDLNYIFIIFCEAIHQKKSNRKQLKIIIDM